MTLPILGLLLALTSPLLLLPVEKFLPYPHFIEEAVKLVIVVMILKAVKTPRTAARSDHSNLEGLRNPWVWVFMAGFLFAISESVFYLMNIFALGDFMAFPKRLVLTCGLHTGTMMLMYFLGRKNYVGLVVGFVGAISIHYFFNLWVASL